MSGGSERSGWSGLPSRREDHDTAADPIAWGTAQGRWVLAATAGGSALALLDATTVNVALPAIGSGLGAGITGLQWTVNAYTLTLASLILLSGSLADRFGRRRVFQIGIAWFALASILCALAPSLGALVAARAVQGMGAALLTPAAWRSSRHRSSRGSRARAVGAWSGLGGIAAAVGPVLGGWLVGVAGWRSIFWINLPVAAAVLWIANRHVPESRARQSSAVRFDITGAVLATLGLAALTWAMIAAGGTGATPAAWIGAAVGTVSLAGFALVERRAASPIMPFELFASRQFTAVNLVTLVVYGGMAGMFFLLVVDLQQAAGYSPLAAGAALAPVTVLMLLLSARAGALAERIGPRLPMTLGPLTMAAGMLLLSRLGTHARYLEDVLPGAIVFGLGLSATVAPLTATLLAAADARLSGVASAVNNAIARSASLLAVAGLPVLAGLTGGALHDAARFSAGFAVAMQISAALVAGGGLLAWITIRNQLREGGAACPHHTLARRHHCAVDAPPWEARDGGS